MNNQIPLSDQQYNYLLRVDRILYEYGKANPHAYFNHDFYGKRVIWSNISVDIDRLVDVILNKEYKPADRDYLNGLKQIYMHYVKHGHI